MGERTIPVRVFCSQRSTMGPVAARVPLKTAAKPLMVFEGKRRQWIIEDMTLYFWGVTVVVLLVRLHIFNQLRPHFSDMV